MTGRDLTIGFCSFILGVFAGLVLMSFAWKAAAPFGNSTAMQTSEEDPVQITWSASAGTVEPLEPVATAMPMDPENSGEAVDPAEEAVESPVARVEPRTVVVEINGRDLQQTFRALARAAGVNMVVSEQVVGAVTMRLTDVTPLKAIDIIAKSKGLYVDVLDGVYYVKTPAERASEPTEPRSYHFKNAKADEALKVFNGTHGLSPAPVLDLRTNTIMYRARISEVEDIGVFLKWLDRPYPPDPSQPDVAPF